MESQTAAVLASRRCVCPMGQLEDRRLVPTEPPRAAEATARDPETGRFRWAAAASLLPTPGTSLERVKQLYAGTGSGRQVRRTERPISWTSKMVVLKERSALALFLRQKDFRGRTPVRCQRSRQQRYRKLHSSTSKPANFESQFEDSGTFLQTLLEALRDCVPTQRKPMIDYQTRENADRENIHDKTDTTTRQIARTKCSLEIRSGSHRRSIRRRSAGSNLQIFSLTLSRLSYRGFCL